MQWGARQRGSPIGPAEVYNWGMITLAWIGPTREDVRARPVTLTVDTANILW